ncbi:DinB family protein [Albimonas sp. CAU 1670]|uniref:DinB family protein n=1 Tax=Albimonas sp. CAU 1670 TaxID=3032599 RepID=UPI0023D9EABD|nr:DinB family protein [Albimonas sp. CAU 1670]MDF2232639.1 DinB family protein [Albimonas sp. CAU 1670]
MKAHFASFARYNAWANRRLYAAASQIDDAQRRSDQGAFFKSLHGTLNHLLVTDVIWMARLRGIPGPSWTLDHVAHDDFEELRAAREAQDADIVQWIDALPESDILATTLSYTRVSSPEPIVQPMAEALAHVFNHQTHHRGHCHMILTRLTGTAPELDLLFYQREAKAAA